MDEWIHNTTEKVLPERQGRGMKNTRGGCVGEGQGFSAIIKHQTADSLSNTEKSLCQIIIIEFEKIFRLWGTQNRLCRLPPGAWWRAWIRATWRVRPPGWSFWRRHSRHQRGQVTTLFLHREEVPVGQSFPMTDTSPPERVRDVYEVFVVLFKNLIETLPLLVKKERRRKLGKLTFIPCLFCANPCVSPALYLNHVSRQSWEAGILQAYFAALAAFYRWGIWGSDQLSSLSGVICLVSGKIGFKFILPGFKNYDLVTESHGPSHIGLSIKREKINYYPIKFGKQEEKYDRRLSVRLKKEDALETLDYFIS